MAEVHLSVNSVEAEAIITEYGGILEQKLRLLTATVRIRSLAAALDTDPGPVHYSMVEASRLAQTRATAAAVAARAAGGANSRGDSRIDEADEAAAAPAAGKTAAGAVASAVAFAAEREGTAAGGKRRPVDGTARPGPQRRANAISAAAVAARGAPSSLLAAAAASSHRRTARLDADAELRRVRARCAGRRAGSALFSAEAGGIVLLGYLAAQYQRAKRQPKSAQAAQATAATPYFGGAVIPPSGDALPQQQPAPFADSGSGSAYASPSPPPSAAHSAASSSPDPGSSPTGPSPRGIVVLSLWAAQEELFPFGPVLRHAASRAQTAHASPHFPAQVAGIPCVAVVTAVFWLMHTRHVAEVATAAARAGTAASGRLDSAASSLLASAVDGRRRDNEETLLHALGGLLQLLSASIDAHKDEFYASLPFVAAQAIIQGFHTLFPGSKDLFDAVFEAAVRRDACSVLAGVPLSDTAVAVATRLAFPAAAGGPGAALFQGAARSEGGPAEGATGSAGLGGTVVRAVDSRAGAARPATGARVAAVAAGVVSAARPVPGAAATGADHAAAAGSDGNAIEAMPRSMLQQQGSWTVDARFSSSSRACALGDDDVGSSRGSSRGQAGPPLNVERGGENGGIDPTTGSDEAAGGAPPDATFLTGVGIVDARAAATPRSRSCVGGSGAGDIPTPSSLAQPRPSPRIGLASRESVDVTLQQQLTQEEAFVLRVRCLAAGVLRGALGPGMVLGDAAPLLFMAESGLTLHCSGDPCGYQHSALATDDGDSSGGAPGCGAGVSGSWGAVGSSCAGRQAGGVLVPSYGSSSAPSSSVSQSRDGSSTSRSEDHPSARGPAPIPSGSGARGSAAVLSTAFDLNAISPLLRRVAALGGGNHSSSSSSRSRTAAAARPAELPYHGGTQPHSLAGRGIACAGEVPGVVVLSGGAPSAATAASGAPATTAPSDTTCPARAAGVDAFNPPLASVRRSAGSTGPLPAARDGKLSKGTLRLMVPPVFSGGPGDPVLAASTAASFGGDGAAAPPSFGALCSRSSVADLPAPAARSLAKVHAVGSGRGSGLGGILEAVAQGRREMASSTAVLGVRLASTIRERTAAERRAVGAIMKQRDDLLASGPVKIAHVALELRQERVAKLQDAQRVANQARTQRRQHERRYWGGGAVTAPPIGGAGGGEGDDGDEEVGERRWSAGGGGSGKSAADRLVSAGVAALDDEQTGEITRLTLASLKGGGPRKAGTSTAGTSRGASIPLVPIAAVIAAVTAPPSSRWAEGGSSGSGSGRGVTSPRPSSSSGMLRPSAGPFDAGGPPRVPRLPSASSSRGGTPSFLEGASSGRSLSGVMRQARSAAAAAASAGTPTARLTRSEAVLRQSLERLVGESGEIDACGAAGGISSSRGGSRTESMGREEQPPRRVASAAAARVSGGGGEAGGSAAAQRSRRVSIDFAVASLLAPPVAQLAVHVG